MNIFANIAREALKSILTAFTKLTQKNLNKSKISAPNPEKESDKYELTFFDDFDTINKDIWTIDNCPRHGGYWCESQVFAENSVLKIRTEYKKDGKFGAGFYTGSIGTRAVQEPFGYYETRFRVPKAKGFWSAFWLMQDGFGGSARNGAEIDIVELPSINLEHRIHSNNYKSRIGASIKVGDLYGEKWHIGSMEWTAESMKFYVDGKLSWQTTDPKHISQVGAGSMIFSSEINGANSIPEIVIGWPIVDLVSKNPINKKYDFEIDYVKVYKIIK